MKKFAILSHTLPPSPYGQSVMLSRILSFVNPSDYYLIASRPQQGHSEMSPLTCQTFTLPEPPEFQIGNKSIRNVVNLMARIIARVRSLVVVLRHEPVGALVACSGAIEDIPAGFIASRVTRTPFYAYIFDDYVYQWVGNPRRFASLIAPFIFEHTAGIIGPNEFICEEYRRRYGVQVTMVRNPCDINELGKEPLAKLDDGRIKILYTGAVYHANFDCFRNLLCAIDSLTEYPIELHIYTAQTRQQLRDQGIVSNRMIIHPHMEYQEILGEQRKADMLFLPLAFDSPIPEVIRTSAPGKLGEYLASGRPILAHVPADSFVAYYCGVHHCAVVADKSDPVLLAKQIEFIITNPELCSQMVGNALSRAKIDFHPRVASQTLLELLA